MEIKYKYNEDQLLKELSEYIDSTYGQHYAQSKIQATEFVIDTGHGLGFCIGSIIKYVTRFGKKEGYNRKDILKMIHYGIILLHIADKE